MKLSVWQQFSSNHSANFTTVGQFESPEWAQEAFKEIQEIIQNIHWWHEHIKDEENALASFNKILKDPSTATGIPKLFTEAQFIEFLTNYNAKFPKQVVEAYYQEHYKVSEWRKPLDWIGSNSKTRDIETFQDLVIICPFPSTWAGYEPFHTILGKLGAKVNSSYEGVLSLAINIECDAPSVQTAQMIVEQVKTPLLSDDWVWIRIQGLGDSRRMKETELFVDAQHIFVKNFQLVSMNNSRQWLSLGDNLKGLIAFFQQMGCTNIQYSFSTIE